MESEPDSNSIKEEECKHGMVPSWCANCKGLLSAEEEEAKEELDAIKHWADIGKKALHDMQKYKAY